MARTSTKFTLYFAVFSTGIHLDDVTGQKDVPVLCLFDRWGGGKKIFPNSAIGQEQVRTNRDLEVANLVKVRMLMCVIETRN